MPQIRRYRASDWDAFVALDVDTGLQTLRYATEEERQAFKHRWPDVLRERYGWGDEGPTRDRSVVYVLEDPEGGGYAGHLWLTEQEDVRTGIVGLWVTMVAIAPRYRSRGWGRLLMERAEEEARTRGLATVGLSVDADNVVARKLYEEMGFQTVRLRMVHRVGTRASRRPVEE